MRRVRTLLMIRWRRGRLLLGVFLSLTAVASATSPNGVQFRRGDANADGTLDISDPIYTLSSLFLGEPGGIRCLDAADSDDDGKLDLGDAARSFYYLFLVPGPPPPPEPFAACGPDPSVDPLDCGAFPPCPVVDGPSLIIEPYWAVHYTVPEATQLHVVGVVVPEVRGGAFVAGNAWNTEIRSDFITHRYDSDGTLLWSARHGEPGGVEDQVVSLALDGEDGVVVAGYTEERTGRRGDVLTIRYGPAGEVLWTARYDSGGPDTPAAMVVSPSGHVYIAGDSGVDQDFIVVHYDDGGELVWVGRAEGAEGPYAGYARAMALDTEGNSYVTGTSTSPTGLDFATMKFDADGRLLWKVNHDGPSGGWDEAYAVAVDGRGNVLVAGEMATSPNVAAFGLVKYSPEGRKLWSAIHSPYSGISWGDTKPAALAVDSAGNAFVAGPAVVSGRDTDFLTVKFDPSGRKLWDAVHDGPAGGDDQARGLVLDSSGRVYVTGWSSALLTGKDFTTVVYDADGRRLAVGCVLGPSDDQALSLALDATGDLYVAGISQSPGSAVDFMTVRYRIAEDPE